MSVDTAPLVFSQCDYCLSTDEPPRLVYVPAHSTIGPARSCERCTPHDPDRPLDWEVATVTESFAGEDFRNGETPIFDQLLAEQTDPETVRIVLDRPKPTGRCTVLFCDQVATWRDRTDPQRPALHPELRAYRCVDHAVVGVHEPLAVQP